LQEGIEIILLLCLPRTRNILAFTVCSAFTICSRFVLLLRRPEQKVNMPIAK
jgi:hypothetical protein